MRDLAEKWSVVPDWRVAAIDAPHLAVRTVSGLHQLIVSGDLAAWSRKSKLKGEGVGAFGHAGGGRYAVRLARDRLLAVSDAALKVPQGWHAEGFGVTEVGAGLHVFEIEGAADDLLARGTTLDPDKGSASAALLLAGVGAVVYRHEDRTRVHVDRALAPYLWKWMETAAGHIAGA